MPPLAIPVANIGIMLELWFLSSTFHNLMQPCPMQPKRFSYLTMAHLVLMHLKHKRAEQGFIEKWEFCNIGLGEGEFRNLPYV